MRTSWTVCARCILLTDANGNILIDSPTYDSIGIDSPNEIRRIMALKEPEFHIRWDAAGTPYIIKAWVYAGRPWPALLFRHRPIARG